MLTFEQTQLDVAEVKKDLKELKALLLNKADNNPEADTPIGIKEASKFIGKTVTTVYGYCQRNEIPYNKVGNKLLFFKSELIEFIKQGKVKTLKELEADVELYLSNKNKGLK